MFVYENWYIDRTESRKLDKEQLHSLHTWLYKSSLVTRMNNPRRKNTPAQQQMSPLVKVRNEIIALNVAFEVLRSTQKEMSAVLLRKMRKKRE